MSFIEEEPVPSMFNHALVKYMNIDIVADILVRLREELPKGLVYHSAQHTVQVLTWAMRLGVMANLSDKDMERLAIAASYHDAGYIIRPNDNEALGIAYAIDAIGAANLATPERYSEEDVQTVAIAIASTEMIPYNGTIVQRPQNELGKFLCDADLYSLGQPGMIASSVALMIEYGLPLSDYQKFFSKTIAMMKAHQWHTKQAQELFFENKFKNLIELTDANNTQI